MKPVLFVTVPLGGKFYDVRCGQWLKKNWSMYNFNYKVKINHRPGNVIWTNQTLVYVEE